MNTGIFRVKFKEVIIWMINNEAGKNILSSDILIWPKLRVLDHIIENVPIDALVALSAYIGDKDSWELCETDMHYAAELVDIMYVLEEYTCINEMLEISCQVFNVQ
jgi:hypothetical protein